MVNISTSSTSNYAISEEVNMLKAASKKIRGAALVVALAWGFTSDGAFAEYIADFSTSDVTNDFRYAMLGGFGATPTANNRYYYTNEALRLEGRYNQAATVGLVVGDDGSGLDNGRFTNNVTASMSFTYSGGVSSNTVVAMGLGMRTNSGANTYPAYRATIVTNTLTLQRQWEFGGNGTTNLDSFALSTTLGLGNDYQMNFSSTTVGTNSYGRILDLSVEVFENNILIASLLYTDTPTATTGSGATYSSGYVGVAAGGGPQSDNIFRGIEITEFSVVPEPASAMLTLLGLTAFAFYTKRHRRS